MNPLTDFSQNSIAEHGRTKAKKQIGGMEEKIVVVNGCMPSPAPPALQNVFLKTFW